MTAPQATLFAVPILMDGFSVTPGPPVGAEAAPLLTVCEEGARLRALWYAVAQTVAQPLAYPQRTASIVRADATRTDVQVAYGLYLSHRGTCPRCQQVHVTLGAP